jgi:amino acid adenylation domain-containing protein
LKTNEPAVDFKALEFSLGPAMPLKPNLPHRRFEEYVNEIPDSIAVFYEGGQLTYAQLNWRANYFGRMLKTYNVGPEQVVVLYMDRSPELVVGTIAIHKAGGACAFIEPAVTLRRLEVMFAEVKPTVILTTKKYRQKLQNIEASLIVMDEVECSDNSRNISLSAGELSPENLSYIFFTSGSSGTPKAVMSTYGYMSEQNATVPGSERHILKTDSGTTFTRAEILRPLLSGQQLFILPLGLEKNFQELSLYISKHNITHLISTPTALRVLLDSDHLPYCHSLKSVTCSGENIPLQLKKDFLSRLDAELHIIYGCTEVPGAVSMTLRRGEEHDLQATGRPGPMMEVYVLDGEMQPVSIGVEGEVYLGGQMAKGYFNDSHLTLQKFVSNPFSSIPGKRLFKSGDRGRWMPNGYLQVLGRADSQIKIRGYRVELGEIEGALQTLPQVRHAVVMLSEDSPDHKFLTAYLVPRVHHASVEALRIALKQVLPEYMIPRNFVLLSELPLTASGKVDRIALLHLQPKRVVSTRSQKHYDSFERHLIAIWENLLKVSPVGIHDNFFDLGGHSLLAAQMMEQIQKTFQKTLPLDFLWFHEGTIDSIARVLRDQYQFGFNPELVLIKKGSRQPLFAVHIMGGYLIDYYELVRYLDPEQTVYGLQARGVFGNGIPDYDVKVIAANCIIAMRQIQPQGPYLIAGYSSGGVVAYEMVQQLNLSGEKVALLAMLDTFCPSVYQVHRWYKAIRLLCHGKTHRLRNLIYSVLLTTFRLKKFLKIEGVRKAHKYAHMSYQPQDTSQEVDFFIAEETAGNVSRNFLGWQKWLKGSVRVHNFNVSHSDLVRLPKVEDVAKTLQACIIRVISD